jgi:hypothetical protein
LAGVVSVATGISAGGNERIHCSVIAKHQEKAAPLYDPPNLPAHIPAEKIASLTDEERQLLERGT